jgi:hypothetical protein
MRFNNEIPCSAGEQLRQNLTAVEIDSYCALAFARASMRAMASGGEALRQRARDELETEISGAMLQQAPEAVLSLMEEMRRELAGPQPSGFVYID